MLQPQRFPIRTLAAGCLLALSLGCSSKASAPSPSSGTNDAGANAPDAAPNTGNDATTPMMPMHIMDASTANADAMADASGPVSYTIPSAGGTVSVTGGSGQPINFAFPASAAGVAVTLTPVTAADIGWPAATFEDVIQMEPDGTTFSDPVIITSGSGTPLAFSFPTSSTQSAPEALELSADKQGLDLHHFSTLAFVPPGQSCEGDNGWVVSQDSSACADAGAGSQLVTLSCTGSSFCYQMEVSCCAPAAVAAAGCSMNTGYANLQIAFTRIGAQGGQYPYCAIEGGAAGGDASSAAPTLLTLEPTSGPVGASVTVTGQDFDTYFATGPLRYAVGFSFETGGTPVSAPDPTAATQDADLNIMHFDVPNIALGTYDVRMNFRDGTSSVNTLPFTITAQ